MIKQRMVVNRVMYFARGYTKAKTFCLASFCTSPQEAAKAFIQKYPRFKGVGSLFSVDCESPADSMWMPIHKAVEFVYGTFSDIKELEWLVTDFVTV